jgi:hypothetical protein
LNHNHNDGEQLDELLAPADAAGWAEPLPPAVLAAFEAFWGWLEGAPYYPAGPVSPMQRL